jgi:hypothetical protein
MIIAAEFDRHMNDCVQIMDTFTFGVLRAHCSCIGSCSSFHFEPVERGVDSLSTQ